MLAELQEAEDWMERGLYARGIAALRALTEKYPKEAKSWRSLGMALARINQPAEALDALTRSTWLIGRDLDTWIAMAVTAHRLDRHKDALGYWKTALEIDSGLFQKRPELSVLWQESRRSVDEFKRLAVRIAQRSDGAAAMLFLSAVCIQEDVRSASEAIAAESSDSRATRIAIAAMAVVLGRGGAVEELAQWIVSEPSETRERLSGQVLGWLGTVAPNATQSIAAVVLASSDRAVARAAYSLPAMDNYVRAAAARVIAFSVLATLRQLDPAA